jgi:hypothetical protein
LLLLFAKSLTLLLFSLFAEAFKFGFLLIGKLSFLGTLFWLFLLR